MQTLHCEYRDHTITASVMAHPDSPLPYAAGCRITDPEGHTSRRIALPLKMAFLCDLENAQHAALAHGRWLVDQQLDGHRKAF
ncbi:hypothetical protein NJF44_13835 [Pseudomonas guariconensis]|uniref:hypothetical protein n=1 Tax=Pseudomonas TaxID=286 RepID=UPI001CE3D584|nr:MULTISPECIES: hypothetical protein [Pseudomonas]MCO7640609.1 hypothetical protein [Pseudomonas sp. S 311-6]MCO7516309.1 hypothetical protein [Pseudomonas putida]MCO7566066.1 hypothetical protein [Pseudomonas mosselii]MCO7596195.1 hypothetical protein [Pseudomonas guariconensis]MCO7606317.1 hypothetical protein [Pseudomonas guariconensis]